MARPRKKTVEYFPHFVTHGKTIYILKEAYGNDGYSFWFQLLEILGDTAGHYLNCQKMGVWEYVVDTTGITKHKASQILATLANLEAIDTELWDKCRVIWAVNFVENVKDVYRRREQDPPTRPEHLLDASLSGVQIPLELVYDDGNAENDGSPTQRKVEDSKPEKSKVFLGSVPEQLRGLELYQSDDKLIKNFTRNYNAWKRAYPHLDVDGEIAKAHVWEMNNPRRRKKDRVRFIGNWLSRADSDRAKRPDQSGRSRKDRISSLEGV